MLFVDFVKKKLLKIKDDSLPLNNNFIKNYYSRNDVKFSTPVFDLNGANVVHPEHKTEKEIEDLYAEIRALQEKNRQKIFKNKFNYNIR